MSDIKDIDDYEARFGFLWKRRSVEKLEGLLTFFTCLKCN